MKFRCKDIRLTILGVWVVLFLSFFNRLLTTFSPVLFFSILHAFCPLSHFLFALTYIYVFIFLDYLDSSSRPSVLFSSNLISCLQHLLFLVSWIFCFLFFYYPFSFENSFPLNRDGNLHTFLLLYILPSLAFLSLSVPQWSFPVFLSV